MQTDVVNLFTLSLTRQMKRFQNLLLAIELERWHIPDGIYYTPNNKAGGRVVWGGVYWNHRAPVSGICLNFVQTISCEPLTLCNQITYDRAPSYAGVSYV